MKLPKITVVNLLIFMFEIIRIKDEKSATDRRLAHKYNWFIKIAA